MSKKLFEDDDENIEDDNLETDLPEEDEEEEFVISKSVSRDKIFDNDYNTGNIDFEEYSNLPKVDASYAEGNLKDCYDSYDYARELNLEMLVDEYFNKTEYGKQFSSKKKIPKQVLPQVFVAIKEQFKGSDYTGSEIFASIADYFSINYEILYENIPSIYRAELVRELDEKYGVLKKKGVKRLF